MELSETEKTLSWLGRTLVGEVEGRGVAGGGAPPVYPT